MNGIERYKDDFVAYLNEKIRVKEPLNLYEPIDYILQLGGKRLRPILAIMTCDIFGGNPKDAYDAALAIEVFHNFTLIHDDIMDRAPIRRGKETVHIKWNENIGILSGDAMMILAYNCLENYEPHLYQKVMRLFNKTALQVCEGQQWDIDFETRDDVTIAEYIKMIAYKTAVLLAAAMKMGAMIAGASDDQQEKIYEFGLNLGLAFQLQDDYLDTFGDQAAFGKQIGGDILENKKTFLLLKAFEYCNSEDKEKLLKLCQTKERSELKVREVTKIYLNNDIDLITKKEIDHYTNEAFSILEKIDLEPNKRNLLSEFGLGLMNRNL